jgi:hypothetical protein
MLMGIAIALSGFGHWIKPELQSLRIIAAPWMGDCWLAI